MFLVLPSVDDLPAFDRIENALDLIRANSPRYFDRLRSTCGSILISVDDTFRATYHHWRRGCDISLSYVLSDPPTAEIATTLIHEATHGMLMDRGVRYREGRRARIEALCVRAELAFLRQLPDVTGDLARRTSARTGLAEERFSDARLRRDRLDKLVELGTPEFIIRRLEALYRRADQAGRSTEDDSPDESGPTIP